VLNAETSDTVQADEHGELRFSTPFRDGETKDISIEWSDTRYVLHVLGYVGEARVGSGQCGAATRLRQARGRKPQRAAERAEGGRNEPRVARGKLQNYRTLACVSRPGSAPSRWP